MTALQLRYGNKLYRVADATHVGMINGRPGVGKSTLLEPIIRSALTGKEEKDWIVRTTGNVVYIDTEQPKDIAKEQDDRILEGISDTSRFKHELIVDYVTSFEKQDRIFDIIDKDPKINICIIDNLSAVVTDINDQYNSAKFKEKINAIANNKNILFIFASHVNDAGIAKGAIGRNIEAISSFLFTLTLFDEVGVTVVKSDKSRYGFVPTTSFSVDFKTKELKKGAYQPFP